MDLQEFPTWRQQLQTQVSQELYLLFNWKPKQEVRGIGVLSKRFKLKTNSQYESTKFLTQKYLLTYSHETVCSISTNLDNVSGRRRRKLRRGKQQNDTITIFSKNCASRKFILKIWPNTHHSSFAELQVSLEIVTFRKLLTFLHREVVRKKMLDFLYRNCVL